MPNVSSAELQSLMQRLLASLPEIVRDFCEEEIASLRQVRPEDWRDTGEQRNHLRSMLAELEMSLPTAIPTGHPCRAALRRLEQVLNPQSPAGAASDNSVRGDADAHDPQRAFQRDWAAAGAADMAAFEQRILDEQDTIRAVARATQQSPERAEEIIAQLLGMTRELRAVQEARIAEIEAEEAGLPAVSAEGGTEFVNVEQAFADGVQRALSGSEEDVNRLYELIPPDLDPEMQTTLRQFIDRVRRDRVRGQQTSAEAAFVQAALSEMDFVEEGVRGAADMLRAMFADRIPPEEGDLVENLLRRLDESRRSVRHIGQPRSEPAREKMED